MNSKFERSLGAAFCVGIVFCLAAVRTPAQSYAQYYSQPALSSRAVSPTALNDDELDNALEASADASDVFRNIAIAQNEVPQDVLLNAAAVGVFKGIFNPALIGGHRRGNGAITVRTPNGWSAPVFYKMRSGFDLEPDAAPASYLLVFMSRESIKDIASGEFDLDHDANVVAGPIIKGSARAFPKSKTVYVYSRGKGSLAGANIDGAKLTARDSVNLDLYGTDALAMLSDPLRLPDMCAACVDPSLSGLPQTVGHALAPQSPYMPATQQQFTIREDCASNQPAPRPRNRGVKVIVIKIINEDEDEEDDAYDVSAPSAQVMTVCPQSQPAPAVMYCPRVRKCKL
jgi:SH3 domain-containing YSC84-like protein 1